MTELLVFMAALIFGTGCSLTSKILLSMESIGLSGEVEKFSNPLFQTCTMFIGMLASLPMHWAVMKFKLPFVGYSHYNKAEGAYIKVGGDEDTDGPKEIPWSVYIALIIPAMFDLAATALCMFGLYHVDVSIYQMLRGGSIVFVAILKQFMLGDILKNFMWVGVSWNVMSIVLVGLTAALAASSAAASGEVEEGSGSDGKPLLGVFLILCGAVVQSLQYAFEEKVMSMDVGAPPLLLIGMEGFWGSLVCITCLYPLAYNLPGADHGSLENPFNTFCLLRNSEDIQWIFTLYFVSIFGYNICCALITFMLNSVWHAILDNFRPITVWSTDLFIFYSVSKSFGEPWTQYSYIQFIGMLVLLYGTAIYNAPNPGSIKLTGGMSSFFMDFSHEYDDMGEESESLTGTLPPSSPHYSSMSPFQAGASPANIARQRVRADSITKSYGTDLEMLKSNKKQASFA